MNMKKKIFTFCLLLFGVTTFHAQEVFQDNNGKFGVKDSVGNIIVSPKYDWIEDFYEGFATVNIGGTQKPEEYFKGGKWGFIDKTGREITPIKYDIASSFINGFAKVGQVGKYSFINKKGKEITNLIYDDTFYFFEDLASVKKDDTYSFIDTLGRTVLRLNKGASANLFSDGLCLVFSEFENNFFIDKTGKKVITFEEYYEDISSFYEGKAVVGSNEKWGYIDKTGKVAIPLIYDAAESFSEGLAAVNIGGEYQSVMEFVGGQWGFIDLTGKLVIPFKYDNAEKFENGLAKVELNGREFFIDKNGNEVSEDE